MKKWIWIVVVVIVAIFIFSSYNGFVSKEEAVNTAWSNVETQYQRRSDLIPNLVNTVKGYAAHESQTLESVTEARSKATSINLTVDELTPETLAAYQQAQGEVRSALGRLIAVAEQYPRPEGQPEFHRAAGPARGDREPHLRGPQGLQRGGAALQHGRAPLPGQPDRRPVRLRAQTLFRGGRGHGRGPRGAVLRCPPKKTRGYVLGAVAAASYGLNPLFALPLYGAGMGVDSVLFYRYLLAVIMLGTLMIFRRHSFALTRRDILPLAVMGLLFSFSSLTLFASYNYMDAGIASTILFLYPVMVAVIMAAFFHERITAATVVSILLACTGIGLLYKGGDGATLSLIGVGLVIVSSLSYAIYIVGVNRSSLRDLSTEKLTFYVLLFGLSIFFGPPARRRGPAAGPPRRCCGSTPFRWPSSRRSSRWSRWPAPSAASAPRPRPSSAPWSPSRRSSSAYWSSASSLRRASCSVSS